MNPISLDELKALCKSPEGRKSLYIIDASPRERFEKEHVAYSFNVPLEELAHKKESALPKDRLVVCYGASPEEAEKAAACYAAIGYQARVFREGLDAWKAADLPVAK